MERRQERSVGEEGASTEHSGQDHDRIDVEMEDAASEDLSTYITSEEHAPESQAVLQHEHRDLNDEMDTTPDASSSDEPDTPDPSGLSSFILTVLSLLAIR